MGLYLYGISSSDYAGGVPEGDDLRVVTASGLAALARKLPENENPHASPDALIEHASILNTWADSKSVLPVRFGTVLPNEGALVSFLEDQASTIKDQLYRFQDKVEIRLTATWLEGAIMKEIAKEDYVGDVSNAQAEENGMSARSEAGKQREQALRRRNHQAAEYLLDHLVRHTEDHHLIEPELDRMLLNAAFLVDRQRLSDFDEELEAADKHFDDRILFKYVGPTPPYHFVELTY